MSLGAYSLSIRDYSKEMSTSRFNIGAITAISLPGTLTAVGTFRSAVDGIILGILAKEQLVVADEVLSKATPALQAAQRENKWVVIYHDNTQFFDAPVNAIPNEGYLKQFKVEIATPDVALLQTNLDLMITNAGAGQTFVTAFEALVKSPYGGAAVVDYVKFVGRNL